MGDRKKWVSETRDQKAVENCRKDYSTSDVNAL